MDHEPERAPRTVYIYGEFEFPADATQPQALEHLFRIACETGGTVRGSADHRTITVRPGYVPGHYTLHWDDPGQPVQGIVYHRDDQG